MFFDKRVKTHGIKKKDRFFKKWYWNKSRSMQKKNLDTENNIFHKIKLLFIHYPNYFHRKTLFFIPYKQ